MEIPPSLIAIADEAIRYASGRADNQKMYLLQFRLTNLMMDSPDAVIWREPLIRYIADHLTHWSDEARLIPEDWVFEREVEENWEYGVGGVTCEEKWLGVNTWHWLMPLGRIFILETSPPAALLSTTSDVQKFADILSQAPLQKLIIRTRLPEHIRKMIHTILAEKSSLRNLKILYPSSSEAPI